MYANSDIQIFIKDASSVELGLKSIARATTGYIRSCIQGLKTVYTFLDNTKSRNKNSHLNFALSLLINTDPTLVSA